MAMLASFGAARLSVIASGVIQLLSIRRHGLGRRPWLERRELGHAYHLLLLGGHLEEIRVLCCPAAGASDSADQPEGCGFIHAQRSGRAVKVHLCW